MPRTLHQVSVAGRAAFPAAAGGPLRQGTPMVTLAQGEDSASQSVAMLLKKWDSAHDSMKTAPKQQNGHTSDHCNIESHAGDTNAVAKAATAAPTLHADTHINACPFRHGSVGVKPFPVRLQPVRVVAHTCMVVACQPASTARTPLQLLLATAYEHPW